MHQTLNVYLLVINVKNQEDIQDWDRYNLSNINRYMYKIPLCYQLFPDTENKKNWSDGENIYNTIMINYFKFNIKVLKLDKQCEPGYSIYYFISKYLNLLWIIIIIIIIVFKLIYYNYI